MVFIAPSPTVPHATSLSDIYTPDILPTQSPRWASLQSAFSTLYGHAPSFIARSPGRVNVIGEHIDYSLYPVLPMAISADVLLAVSAPPSSSPSCLAVRVANVDPRRYPTREFTIPLPKDPAAAVHVGIDATAHEWSNYFKAGLGGALGLLRQNRQELELRDLNILVDGTVPPGGGLSSSAAFVSSSALAVLAALGGTANIDRRELTEVAIVSERAVGVNSGGMDQSASVLSEPGAALLVSFHPKLTSAPISFKPTEPPLSFVIAQSFVVSDKQLTAPVNYNLRVVECTLAALLLNKFLPGQYHPLEQDKSPLRVSLRGFHDRYFTAKKLEKKALAEELQDLIPHVEQTLTKEEGYTLEEIAEGLEMSLDSLKAGYLSGFPVRATHFKLRQRALHVYGEALRVQRFMSLLGPSSSTCPSHLPTRLGEILNESQTSCRELYECSCPELDEICRIARGAGSFGSRLTGAGWGGCSVHIVAQDKVAHVTRALEEKYYRTRGEQDHRDKVVVTTPGIGSVLYQV